MPLLMLNPGDPAPLYQQIANKLQDAIVSGELKPGDKLPTVRELSQSLSTASGTVKRAYEELCRSGMLVMTQGKGTFVAQPSAADSRKEQAMDAIDAMLDRMEALSFSSREIQIFLDLKLRERMRDNGLRVAVIDACPEGLRMLSDRLSGIADCVLYPMLLDEVLSETAQFGEEMDLVVTNDSYYHTLRPLLGDSLPLLRLCLEATDATLLSLARLPRASRIGVLAQSQIFVERVRALCRRYCPEAVLQGSSMPDSSALCDLLSCCDAVLTPLSFEQFSPPDVLQIISGFTETHPLVRLEWEPDQGSMRILEESLRSAARSRR